MRYSLILCSILFLCLLTLTGCDTGTGPEDENGDDDTAPGAPELLYPADGAVDVELRPRFQWTDGSTDGSLDMDPSAIEFKHESATVERESANDDAASSRPPAERSAEAPSVSNTRHESVERRESSVRLYALTAPAGSYRLQVDEDPAFGSPEIDIDDLTDCEYTPDFDLFKISDYYWRVRGSNAYGDGDWSDAFSFSTRPPIWHVETVDFMGEMYNYISLALDIRGFPHISYSDYDNHDLKYAAWNGEAWEFETVDTECDYMVFNSMIIDSRDIPHIAYHGRNGDVETLSHTSRNTWGWDLEIVDYGTPDIEVGYYASIDLDCSDHPHIACQSRTRVTYSVMYAGWTGEEWLIETVDTNDGDKLGYYTSLKVDSSGNPHIAYHDNTNEILRHAYRSTAGWQIETVDAQDDVGWNSSLAIDSLDHLHISYFDSTSRDLKYAHWDGATWQIETIDTYGDAGSYNSLALDSHGYPHIAYYQADDRDLKYAYWDGSRWVISFVETLGAVGLNNSLALDDSDNAHIAYYDDSYEVLKYAWCE